jgi:hypothetical protein
LQNSRHSQVAKSRGNCANPAWRAGGNVNDIVHFGSIVHFVLAGMKQYIYDT